MKKKQKTPSGDYRKPVLYLDDLEEIIEIFSSISDVVVIEHDDCEYDSLKELLEDNPQACLNSLLIKGPSFGGARIDLKDSRVLDSSVSIYSNEDSVVAAFYKIDTILRRAERVSFLDKLYWWWIVATMALWALPPLMGSSPSPYHYIAIIYCLLYVVWSASMGWRFLQKTQIHLQRKRDKTSFFKRKKDDLILVLITAFVTACLTVLVTVYVEPMFSSSHNEAAVQATSNATSPTPDK